MAKIKTPHGAAFEENHGTAFEENHGFAVAALQLRHENSLDPSPAALFARVAASDNEDEVTAITKWGPRAILEGMASHPTSTGVQTLGLEGLVIVASASLPRRAEVASEDGLAACIRAMRGHAHRWASGMANSEEDFWKWERLYSWGWET